MKEEIAIKERNNSCPEDGVCTIEIIKNKSMLIKTDDINAIYFQMEDNPETSIIKYSYSKNTNKEFQDASYVEEVIFEVKNSISTLKLTDLELQNTKMLFGRHCYCKGQAGYFLIQKGQLDLFQDENGYTINLNFIITEVPQIINTINTSIK